MKMRRKRSDMTLTDGTETLVFGGRVEQHIDVGGTSFTFSKAKFTKKEYITLKTMSKSTKAQDLTFRWDLPDGVKEFKVNFVFIHTETEVLPGCNDLVYYPTWKMISV